MPSLALKLALVLAVSTLSFSSTLVVSGQNLTKSTVRDHTPAWGHWNSLDGIITAAPTFGSNSHDTFSVFVRRVDADNIWERSFSAAGWSSWIRHHGWLASAPAVTSPAYRWWHLAALGFDNNFYVRTYDSVNWYHWQNIGGLSDKAPAIASWSTSRCDVFARNMNGKLMQRTKNNGFWGKWRVHPDGYLTSAPAALARHYGVFDVVVRDVHYGLSLKQYVNGVWGPWESLHFINATSAPALASWGPKNLNVFVKGPRNSIWWRSRNNGRWSGWENLGGVSKYAPSAVSPSINRIALVVVGTDSKIHIKHYE